MENARHVELTIEVDPVPASRPRVTRFGTYYGAPYKKWMAAAAKELEGQAITEKFTGPVAVAIEVICKRPAKPANEYPVGDVDNYAKGPLDAINSQGSFWNDDKQVVQLNVTKRYAEKGEKPHSKILITESEL